MLRDHYGEASYSSEEVQHIFSGGDEVRDSFPLITEPRREVRHIQVDLVLAPKFPVHCLKSAFTCKPFKSASSKFRLNGSDLPQDDFEVWCDIKQTLCDPALFVLKLVRQSENRYVTNNINALP